MYYDLSTLTFNLLTSKTYRYAVSYAIDIFTKYEYRIIPASKFIAFAVY